jgi:nitroreductase
MDRGQPDHETVRAAITLATRAPSVHNSQPWQWRIADRSLHLYADPDLHLDRTDPDQRDLLISCGAALHHVRVAFGSLGWRAEIHRLPNPAEPNHLAAIELHCHRASVDDIEAATAIARRRTDRRIFSDWPIPAGNVHKICTAASAEGVVATEVPDGPARMAIRRAINEAARLHSDDADYQLELAVWSGRHGSLDGVPAANATKPSTSDEPARAFATAELPQSPGRHDSIESAILVVLSTPSDDALSRLRAGEATSAALLAATAAGLATCPMTEPLEIRGTRDLIRLDALDDTGFPQMLVRVGWAPVSAEPPPRSPRRHVDDVLQHQRD